MTLPLHAKPLPAIYLRPLITLALITIAISLLALTANAAPADPRPFLITQPDGTTFMAKETGDEFAWGYITADSGHTVKKGEDGFWHYLDKSTGLLTARAGSAAPAATDNRYLFITSQEQADVDMARSAQALYGNVRVDKPYISSFERAAFDESATTIRFPVIPAEFPDLSHTYSTSAINSVFFGDHTSWTPYGSVSDFYEEVSYGAWSLAGDTSGWVTVEDSYSYYLKSELQMTGSAARDLVLDAVIQADASFDFGPYDNDGDGYVDSVIIVYADTDETYNWPIRPHSWELVDDYVTGDLNSKGMPCKIRHYIIVSEKEHRGDGIMTVGVACHELGHVFGLTDLYTEWEPQNVGSWDVMGTGSWNGIPSYNGNCPAHLSAWNKATLGLMTPQQVTQAGTLTILPVETVPLAYQFLDNPYGYEGTLFDTSGTGQFFLVELRRKQGFDRGLPGEGVLIWHVDEYNTLWDRRNNYEDTKLLDLEEADGAMLRGDAGDPWANSVTGFTGATDPSSLLYNGRPSGIAITQISAVSDSMTFIASLTGPSPTPTPVPDMAPEIRWQRTIDGHGNETSYAIKQTSDGGFVTVGGTDADGNLDVYLLKLDADGNPDMESKLGWDSEDVGFSIEIMPSGDYMISGHTDYYGDVDVLLMKVWKNGTIHWSKTYGWASNEGGYSMVAASDGGYVISGYTDYYGDYDVYLIKVDSSGEVVWDRIYGTTKDEEGFGVCELDDGGYAVVGYQENDTTGYDVYLIRTDDEGNQDWAYSYTGSKDEWGNSIMEVEDGFVIAGESYDFGSDLDLMNDAFMLKLNKNGDVEWSEAFGGALFDWGSAVIGTNSGYLMAGSTHSYDKASDLYLVKTEESGEVAWTMGIGGAYYEYGWSIIETSDGGYAACGSAYDPTYGDSDVYVVKLEKEQQAPVITETIALKSGWNLISLPVVNDTIWASGFAGKGVTMVADYDRVKSSFNVFIIGASPQSSDINLLPDHAYWVMCSRDTQLTFTGQTPVSRYADIYPGFNFIGWSDMANSTAQAATGAISGIQYVYGYDAGADKWDIYMEGVSPVQNSFPMVRGEGYAVYSLEATTQRLWY